MAVQLSESEKVFLIEGLQEDMRFDGRRPDEYRPLVLEVDCMPGCSGSCRVRVGNTDILVGVKAEISTPDLHAPSCGKLCFAADCSANCAPQFEGRGGEDISSELAGCLSCAYANALDTHKLGIVKGELCWALMIDILILQIDGGLLDSASVAVKIALERCALPQLTVRRNEEDNKSEIEVNDKLEPWSLHELVAENSPCVSVVHKIGWCNVLDATPAEYVCSKACLIMACNAKGQVTLSRQQSGVGGSLDCDSVADMLLQGTRATALLHTLAKQHFLGRQVQGGVA